MLAEENKLLTQTGPGAPCGELMRRFWQPAALSEELPPGGAPLPITLLGEELVLFRDHLGGLGLIDGHCAHRGADLSYGRLEDGGLRCIYHGWLYDVNGKIVDMPGEVDGGKGLRDSICHKAYRVKERNGVIFAYLGPGEPPLFPSYQFLNAPPDRSFAIKLYSECNYLQGNEGNIDLAHLSFLHYNYNTLKRYGIGGELKPLDSRGAAPGKEVYDAELTAYGVRSYKIWRNAKPGFYHLYVTEFVLPNLTTFGGGGYAMGGYSVNWHVPIDDARHWKYTFMYSTTEPISVETLRRTRAQMTPDYRPLNNRANRYDQRRQSMREEGYCGLGLNFQIQDLCVTEGMGAIMDRTREHLTAMDRPMIAARKLLLKAINDLREGREPANVARDPQRNHFQLVACEDLVPESMPWKEYIRAKTSAKKSSHETMP
jgi:phenylpropionate dioxygenase-like ring-hydroxylating dioxygenase large terminal subunit